MSKAQLVITAVVLEGRSKSEVARDYDVSRNWVQQLIRRYETEARRRSNPTHADPATTHAPWMPRWKNTLCGSARPWPKPATTPAPPPSPNTCPATPPSPMSLQYPRSGASWAAADSSHPSPRNDRVPPGNASKPTYPTNCGKPMSPTGVSPTPPRWRSSTFDDHSRAAIASIARSVTTGPDVVDTITAAFAD
jgi:hypothetical protein